MEESEVLDAIPYDIEEVNSESESFPAKNIGDSESSSPWEIDSEDAPKEAILILKLGKPSRIGSIKVTNHWTAFIEIQGWRATTGAAYETLVVKSSLMTPVDSRTKQNGDIDRDLNLKPGMTNVSWEKLKLICQQPFNKDLKFGLQSVSIFAPKSSVNGFGHVQLKKKNATGDIKPGDLFSAGRSRTSEESEPKPSTHSDEEMPDAAKPSDLEPTTSKGENRGEEPGMEEKDEVKSSTPAEPKESPKRGRGRPPKGSPSTSKVKPKPPVKRRKDADDESEEDEDDEGTSRSKKTRKGAKKDSLREIMKGCNIVLSGFQNPVRGELREKAVEMGAKYKPDWGPDCTHLICAFPNTPKFNQVRAAGGRIVKKEWIEECYEAKRMLPWRTFMLKPTKSAADDEEENEMEDAKENEDEEWEPDFEESSGEEEDDEEVEHELESDEFDDPLSDVDEEFSGHEDVDADEYSESSGEDRKSRKKRGGFQKAKTAKPKKKQKSPKRRRGGVRYDDDEEETEEEDNESDLDLTDTEEPDIAEKDYVPRQRPLFRNMVFFLYGEFPHAEEEAELKKIIRELAGVVKDTNDESVTHCVTPLNWCSEFEEVLAENPSIMFVTPNFVYDCQKERRPMDARKFKPKHA